MLNLRQDIHPLTNFERNTADFVKQMKKIGRPVVLTVNGKAELVVQDARTYQDMLERERFEVVEAIHQGLSDVEEGHIHGARGALEKTQSQTWHTALGSLTRLCWMPRSTSPSFVMARKSQRLLSAGWGGSLPPFFLDRSPAGCALIPETEEFAFKLRHLLFHSHHLSHRGAEQHRDRAPSLPWPAETTPAQGR